MSSPKFVENENAISRREPYGNSGNGCGGLHSPPATSLKIRRDSHFIKKPPSPSSSSAVAVAKPRHPVIIYTHSPKVIHTNPNDFMALVQKLTGMSPSDVDSAGIDRRSKPLETVVSDHGEDNKNSDINHHHHHQGYDNNSNGNGCNKRCTGNRRGIFVNDRESSSVITTEESIGEQGQVSLSYCSLAAIPPPSPAMLDAVALSAPGINYGAYLSTNPSDGSLGNYEMDPLFLAPIPTMRISSSSSSSHGFDGLSEFREY